MGEIANDMINGACCSHCGVYFSIKGKNGSIKVAPEHGYPVLCHHCFDNETPEERAGIQRAIYEDE